MGYIGVITHLLSIDPNFLDIQVPRFGSPWTRGVPDPVRQCVTSARHLGPHRPPRCQKMVGVSEIQRENHRLGFFFCCKEMGYPPKQLTCQQKTHHWKMYFLLKLGIFQCHVSFQGSEPTNFLSKISGQPKFPDFPSFSLVFQLLETRGCRFFAEQTKLPLV